MASVLVVTTACIKFEFTDDATFSYLKEGVFAIRRTYDSQTDTHSSHFTHLCRGSPRKCILVWLMLTLRLAVLRRLYLFAILTILEMIVLQ